MVQIVKNSALRRKRRVSSSIRGTRDIPRISVFRSNRYIYAQAIDDAKRVTLAHAFQKKHSEKSSEVGMTLGKKLMEKGIKKAVFDRGMYAYRGNVKRLAEGIRKSGIQM